ncbi:MAG: cytochrome C [Arcobacter sp.]|uniref:heme-binding domain-containing protein n=1 Tax=uncultured Arcobacter sp. TaxID=165434 RepID=UPI000CB9D60C|nr:heme-binding domain-containing protein [uncultured Arcobacter sp.]PLY09393.1 MAG: cytochrome C [Arcobacter sp.]
MKITILVFFIILLLMQAIQIDKTNPIVDKSLEIQAPTEVMGIFKNACYDCHSNQTIWPWYSSIAPASWMLKSHVDDGRKSLDFTSWESYSKDEKTKKLKEIYRTVYAAMPLASYVSMHKKAELSKEQRELIRTWTGVRR